MVSRSFDWLKGICPPKMCWISLTLKTSIASNTRLIQRAYAKLERDLTNILALDMPSFHIWNNAESVLKVFLDITMLDKNGPFKDFYENNKWIYLENILKEDIQEKTTMNNYNPNSRFSEKDFFRKESFKIPLALYQAKATHALKIVLYKNNWPFLNEIRRKRNGLRILCTFSYTFAFCTSQS